VDKGLQLVKVHLLPFLEWVIVALSTFHSYPSKDTERIGEVVINGIAFGKIAFGSASCEGVALRGEELLTHLVPCHVGLCSIASPVNESLVVSLAPRITTHFSDGEEIIKPVDHVALVSFRAIEVVDQHFPFIWVIKLDELHCLGRIGDTSYRYQKGSAHEGRVICRPRRRDLILLEVARNDRIDPVCISLYCLSRDEV